MAVWSLDGKEKATALRRSAVALVLMSSVVHWGCPNKASSLPATPLPSANLANIKIGVPSGGKLEKASDDRSSLETADYKLMVQLTKKKQALSELKEMVQSMPGFKEIVIEQADGLVVAVEEKGGMQFLITRYVQVGDVALSCQSSLTKPPKERAKAQEAFDVCGTLTKT